MSNLKVTIVVRTKGPNGKRGWVPATGKNDPVGPLYLRYYKGSSPKHIKAGRFYDEAGNSQAPSRTQAEGREHGLRTKPGVAGGERRSTTGATASTHTSSISAGKRSAMDGNTRQSPSVSGRPIFSSSLGSLRSPSLRTTPPPTFSVTRNTSTGWAGRTTQCLTS